MAQNIPTTVSFYTACLRSACAAYEEASEVSTGRNSLPVLERQPSEALDTAQLAFYLEFRRVPCKTVSDIGICVYFQQYANPDPSARREIHEQLVAETAQTDMAGVLALYRFLLTGSHLEDFYGEVFRMLALHVHALPRCVALADLVHHAQEQSDEDVESAAGSAAEDDEECNSTICDSDSEATVAYAWPEPDE